MTCQFPSVTVVIPTFNRGHLINQSVESVLEQTYRDFELIVIDDGSTDNTSDILKKYEGKLQYIRTKNQGRSAARNCGIKSARGKYVAFLDSDDVWLPDKLERQIPLLESSPKNVVLIHGYKKIVNSELKPLTQATSKLRHYYRFAKKGQETYETYITSACIFTSTIVCRRSALLEVGGYDVELEALEDLDLYLRLLLRNYKFCFLSKPPLILYRLHNSNTNSLTSNQAYLKVYEKHLSLCRNLESEQRTKRVLSLLYKAIAQTHYRLGNYSLATDNYKKSLSKSWKIAIDLKLWQQYILSLLKNKLSSHG